MIKLAASVVIVGLIVASAPYFIFYYDWTTYSITIPNEYKAEYISYGTLGSDGRNAVETHINVYVGGGSYVMSQRAPIGEQIHLQVKYSNTSYSEIDHHGQSIEPTLLYHAVGYWSLDFKVGG